MSSDAIEPPQLYLVLKSSPKNYHTYGFSLKENLTAIYLKPADALFSMIRNTLSLALSQIPTMRDNIVFALPYMILQTDEGPYRDALCNHWRFRADLLIRDSPNDPYTIDDFDVVEDDGDVEMESRLNLLDEAQRAMLQVQIDLLNELMQKRRDQVRQEGIDTSSELYRRWMADKRAYVMMKEDGISPPHPLYQTWSLEQLQNLTYSDYVENLQRPANASAWGAMF